MKEIKVKLTVDAGGAKKEIDNVTKSTKKLDKANSNASKSNNSLSASTAKTGVAMGGVATASTTAGRRFNSGRRCSRYGSNRFPRIKNKITSNYC